MFRRASPGKTELLGIRYGELPATCQSWGGQLVCDTQKGEQFSPLDKELKVDGETALDLVISVIRQIFEPGDRFEIEFSALGSDARNKKVVIDNLESARLEKGPWSERKVLKQSELSAAAIVKMLGSPRPRSRCQGCHVGDILHRESQPRQGAQVNGKAPPNTRQGLWLCIRVSRRKGNSGNGMYRTNNRTGRISESRFPTQPVGHQSSRRIHIPCYQDKRGTASQCRILAGTSVSEPHREA